MDTAWKKFSDRGKPVSEMFVNEKLQEYNVPAHKKKSHQLDSESPLKESEIE